MRERTPLGSTMLPTTLLNVAPTITKPSTNPTHLPNPTMLPPVSPAPRCTKIEVQGDPEYEPLPVRGVGGRHRHRAVFRSLCLFPFRSAHAARNSPTPAAALERRG